MHDQDQAFGLQGQVAVITGGARGIGLATAERLGRAGAAVVIADRDEVGCTKAVDSLEKQDLRAIGIALDVTDEDQVQEMTDRTVRELGGYQILVCSAGVVGRNAFAWETSLEEWREVLEVNLTGLWLCNRAALGRMRDEGYGRIVNIASIAGKEGNPKLGPYSASKAGVIGMTKSLAKEVAETNIRIHSVAPAVIHTPMLDQVTQETIDYMVSKIPVGRTGTLRRGGRPGALSGEPRVQFQHGRLLRYLRRPSHILIISTRSTVRNYNEAYLHRILGLHDRAVRGPLLWILRLCAPSCANSGFDGVELGGFPPHPNPDDCPESGPSRASRSWRR